MVQFNIPPEQAEFGRLIRDVNVKPVIEEEVRKVKAEKDFIFSKHFSNKGHTELEGDPSVEHTLGGNLNKIVEMLGLNKHQNEYHENEDS